jgi:very-short-patch-repair endonuclease
LVVEVRMPGHPVRQKSETRDELLRCVMDGAAVMRNNNESIRKATRAVLNELAQPMQEVVSNSKSR